MGHIESSVSPLKRTSTRDGVRRGLWAGPNSATVLDNYLIGHQPLTEMGEKLKAAPSSPPHANRSSHNHDIKMRPTLPRTCLGC